MIDCVKTFININMRNHQPLQTNCGKNIFRFFYTVAAFTFLFATICTLPLLDIDGILSTFKQLITVSAVCMIVAEILEYRTSAKPKFSLVITSIAILGNILYIVSTLIYEQFNNGSLYLISAFFYSFACELKILLIVVGNKVYISELLRQEKFQFIRFGALTLGTILFLTGAAVYLIDNGQEDASSIAGIANTIGGLFTAFSAIVLFKRDQHKGYEKFEQITAIPRIV